ncbi:hypothetical protein RvY_07200 [Ramazzottius varieornatus]|uniref:DDE-1 domain-containing protein n=1 Tax=Ramazzottius varieornatus TaxID=947166 RepID=A0A1D1V3X6_RAMVA|nr:hypothetical protein RvY_07200 [Ramazzottius varieornatus]
MKGSKKATERISVMFCCSAPGEKIPPLIIGRPKKPRTFTKATLDFKKAGFTWANNTKAWMTKAVFTPWLKELNERTEKQNRKILLLLDNASGHNVDNLSHVRLVYLPPNQTSRIQPLDQGTIKVFQVHESAAKAEHRRENRKNFQNLVIWRDSDRRKVKFQIVNPAVVLMKVAMALELVLVYTPGYPALPQPKPQLEIPRRYRLPALPAPKVSHTLPNVK